jgi:hypothetical protein
MDPNVAGYVAASETMASHQDMALAQQELIRARRGLGVVALFIFVVIILQVAAMPSAWATVSVPGNPGTYSLIPTKGLTLCMYSICMPMHIPNPWYECFSTAGYQTDCSTVPFSEINDSGFTSSSHAAIALCVLAMLLSVVGLVGVIGLRQRVRVAANTVSLSPGAAVPILAALAHPFAFSVVLSTAALISNINWIQYLLVSRRMMVRARTSLGLRLDVCL